MATQITNVQVFDVYCNKCKKRREVHTKEGYVTDKNVNYVECICGHNIPIDILIYLFQKKDYIDESLQYYVY
jgi:hypothetical protein